MVLGLLVWTTRAAVTHFSAATLVPMLVSLALLLNAWYARAFALTVQDRVIRLEMRLRMQAVAPQQAARFEEFSPSQLTALRFASDAELPALAQQVLDGKLTKSAEIKKQVTAWKGDFLRA
jgi:hypothetical protein